MITVMVQGLNSGLMLFQLGKMRENVEYKRELDVAKMEELSNRFLPPRAVRDDGHEDKNPTPRNAMSVGSSVTFFTPSNANAHQCNM